MTELLRFPHTPHFDWLGLGTPRSDKVLSAAERAELLRADVLVEEKLDGTNLGISLQGAQMLQFQRRGDYLRPPYVGEFQHLRAWSALHQDQIVATLPSHHILFGEWCFARHTLYYDKLSDWFILFDVYNRLTQKFLGAADRDALAASIGLHVVRRLYGGPATSEFLANHLLATRSGYRSGLMEGIIVRQESEGSLRARAKLVRPEFSQAIGEHWRHRKLELNRLSPRRTRP